MSAARIPRPSADDLWLAAQWLEVYEGAEDADACLRVSKWLRAQSDAAELRAECRKAGVPVAKARAVLAKVKS